MNQLITDTTNHVDDVEIQKYTKKMQDFLATIKPGAFAEVDFSDFLEGQSIGKSMMFTPVYAMNRSQALNLKFRDKLMKDIIENKVIPELIKLEDKKSYSEKDRGRMCTSKVRFKTKRDADIEIGRFMRSGRRKNIAQRSYKCPFCRGYHMTKSNASHKNRIMKKKIMNEMFMEVYRNMGVTLTNVIDNSKIIIDYSVDYGFSGLKSSPKITIDKIRIADFKDKGNLMGGVNVKDSDDLFVTSVINSMNYTIKTRNVKNGHNAAFIASKMVTNDDDTATFYCSVSNKSGEKGIAIMPFSPENEEKRVFIMKVFASREGEARSFSMKIYPASINVHKDGSMRFIMENNLNGGFDPTSDMFVIHN